MLAGWSETHNGGAKLTFWLPDASELDAFRTLTVRKGHTAGQRFMAVLVQIGDDELPVRPEAALVPTQKAPLGRLALLAVQFCQHTEFRQWAGQWFDAGALSEDQAADLIRKTCNIVSRRELDTAPYAAEIFHEQFRKPFNAYNNT